MGKGTRQVKPVFFETQLDFRRWLAAYHLVEAELVVGFYKVKSGKPSMTWSQSVDQALCFGWIDGIRHSIDDISYSIRFTPRRPESSWSAVNIKKVAELQKKGAMQPAGLRAFEKRRESRSQIYSYENRPENFPQDLKSQFQQNPKAWEFFQAQPPYYRKKFIYWVMSAKRETTQLSRLQKLMVASANQKRID